MDLLHGPECRWCGEKTDAEFVDVGVGFQQVTGGECWSCGAYEMGPYLVDGRITEVEMETLWYGPMEDHPTESPFNPIPADLCGQISVTSWRNSKC